MDVYSIIGDVKFWIFSGILIGMLFGFDSPYTTTLIMACLVLQMTFSFVGVDFHIRDFRDCKKEILVSVFCCFVINLVTNLVTGLFFLGNTALWYGWVVFGCTPCAVGVITGAIFAKGDVHLSAVSSASVYIAALLITPGLTYLFLGDAVNPYEILKCILIFIIIPYVLSIPLKKIGFSKKVQGLGINLMLFILALIAVGSRKEYILESPEMIGWLAIACLIRLFLFTGIILLALKSAHVRRENAIIYTLMSVWKSAGITMSLCMVLFGSAYPEAVLPGVVSLLMEMVWLSCLGWYTKKLWPLETAQCAPARAPSAVENN